MNSAEFENLLEFPNSIDSVKTELLEEVLQQFPYFQGARAIQLNGLKKTKSFKYNQALKKTASYTVDRTVLFDFITSSLFIEKKNEDAIIELEEIEVIDAETIKALHEKIIETHSNKTEIEEVQDVSKYEEEENARRVLEINRPIQFNSSESHSFNEWMQLISQKPILREETSSSFTLKNMESESNSSLIDQFIESNPKIKPADKYSYNYDISLAGSTENENLMTETLAKVYLQQNKYANAIKAYEILSLKYPEKSGFFADRIKAIKILQRK